MSTEQQTIFPETNGHEVAVVKGKKIAMQRHCDVCDREYEYFNKGSRFCSDRCRQRASSKNIMTKENTKEGKPEKKADTPSPSFNQLSPHMAIAIDLLKADSKRWQELYNEEKEERKKAQSELARIEKEAKEKEHKQVLQGLEEKKPDLIDRLSNLPPEVIQLFGPIVAKFGNLLIPDSAAAMPMAGVQGQLDEAQLQFLVWVDQLPDDEKKSFFNIIGAITTQDARMRKISFSKIENLLKNGTTIHIDQSMYGN